MDFDKHRLKRGIQKMPAKCVAVINMKGGVGKSTLSFNLAQYLAEFEDARVLLVDLDPQANATIVATEPASYAQHLKTKKTVADLFIAAMKRVGPVAPKPPTKLKVDDYLYTVFSDSKRGRFDLVPSELMLSSVLRGVSIGPYDLDTLIGPQVRNTYDYVIIDCAPTYSILTTIALNSAKAVVIPMIADAFGSHGTKLMRQVLDEHKHDYGVEVKVVGVVFTMYRPDSRTQLENSTNIVKEWGPDEVFSTKIRKSDWYRVTAGRRTAMWNSSANLDTKREFARFVAEFQRRA